MCIVSHLRIWLDSDSHPGYLSSFPFWGEESSALPWQREMTLLCLGWMSGAWILMRRIVVFYIHRETGWSIGWHNYSTYEPWRTWSRPTRQRHLSKVSNAFKWDRDTVIILILLHAVEKERNITYWTISTFQLQGCFTSYCPLLPLYQL